MCPRLPYGETWDFPSPLMGEGQGEGATLQDSPLPLAPSHEGREEKHFLSPTLPNGRVVSPWWERDRVRGLSASPQGSVNRSHSSDSCFIILPASPARKV